MTSKIFWRKRFPENVKNRMWALTVSSLMLFIQIPLTAVAQITREDNYEYLMYSGLTAEEISTRLSQMIADSFLATIAPNNPGTIFLYMMLALGLALNGFAYLYRSNEVDFYHSLPVKREQLFTLNYVTGALFFLVPYAINLVLGTLIILTKAGGALDLGLVFTAFVNHSVYFLFLYGVFILAVMLTGNMMTGILGSFTLASYGSLLTLVISAYMSTFQLTRVWYDHFFERVFANASPAGLYIMAGFSEHPVRYLLIGVIGAAVSAFLALILYKRRMLEAAGRAMAFRITEPVIKYLIGAPVAAAAGIIFYFIMGMDAWAYFAIVFIGLIACFVIEIIFQGDFRKFHARIIVTAAAIVTALLMFVVFRYDLIGYDQRRPAAEKISGVSICIDELSQETAWNYYAEPQLVTNTYDMILTPVFASPDRTELMRKMGEITDPALADPIIDAGLQAAALARQNWDGPNGDSWGKAGLTDNYAHAATVTVRWTLAGGKEMLRTYQVNATALKAEIENLYADPGFLESAYPLLRTPASEIAAVNYCEWTIPVHVQFPDDAAKDRLLETWKQEFRALTAETREKENPIGGLQFKTVAMQEMIDQIRTVKGDYSVFNDYHYYPVYPSFTATIALLKECGIDPGSSLDPAEVGRVLVEYHGYLEPVKADVPVSTKTTEQYYADGTLTVTDPEQIREIFADCVPNVGKFSNPFCPVSNLVTASAVQNSSENENYRRDLWSQFPIDNVPEFLKEHYQIDEDEQYMSRIGLF